MVSAILLHYVIDDPLPTRGTFGDPGTNSGADNFFLLALNVFLFSYMLSSFSTCSYYLNCFSTWYVWLLLEKKKKKKKIGNRPNLWHAQTIRFRRKIRTQAKFAVVLLYHWGEHSEIPTGS